MTFPIFVFVLFLGQFAPLKFMNRCGGEMVSVFASTAVDRWFETWSGKTLVFDVCFSARYVALKTKSKDWLVLNHANVFEWSEMSTRGMMLQ